MTKLLIAAVSLLAFASTTENAVGQGMHVIERDELRALGVSRLSDLLRYVDGVRFMTTDGFFHRTAAGGLSTYDEAAPMVIVDTHPVDVGPLYEESLSTLGIPVEAIERVEIHLRPVVIGGIYTERGAIHIQLRQPAPDIRIDAAIAASNEVGDPGPYRNRGAANIDTQGPDGSISLEAAPANVSGRAAAVFRRHYYTKPVLLGRMADLHDVSRAPIAEVFAPMLTFSWRESERAADVLGTAVVSTLYPHLNHAGREVALDHRAAGVSAAFRHRISDGVVLDHRGSLVAKRSEAPPESNVPFSWRQNRVVLRSIWEQSLRKTGVGLGATGGYERVGAATDAGAAWGELYASLASKAEGKTSFHAAGQVATDGSQVALNGFTDFLYRPGSGHVLSVYAGFAKPLERERDALVFWMRKGVYPATLPPDKQFQKERSAGRLIGDVEWRWRSDGIGMMGGAGIRHFRGYGVARRAFSAMDPPVVGSIAFLQSDGTTGSAWFRIETTLMGARQRFFANVDRTLAGEKEFRQAWDTVPDAQYGMWIFLPVAPDFHVQARLAQQSGSFWHEFADAGSGRIEAATLLDLAFYKRLAAGRLHLQFGLSNLLRERLRFHPLGDTFDLSARLDVRVELGTRR